MKLRDLDVVDSDRELVLRCDDGHCTRPRSGATSFGEDTKIVTLRTGVSDMAELHKEGT